jgi:hypothetical protein
MADERQYQLNTTLSVRPRPRHTAAPAAPATPKVLPPLSEEEHERIKGTVAIIKERCPELHQMIKELHAAGMIDGWRSVTITKVTE